jgi:alkylation response protein AidB-like acyl-CoA dehydrogenase
MGPRSGLQAACSPTSEYPRRGTFFRCFDALLAASQQVARPIDGFTVILIPRVEGVETRPIKTSYSLSAGTAYVTFDNVKVPVEIHSWI